MKSHAWRVVRLRFAFDAYIRAVVAKRLKPEIGRRTELLARRWLPAVGLADCGPPLLASVVEPSGRSVWHVYDDLGCDELDAQHIDRARVIAATELIARIHTRFAGHGAAQPRGTKGAHDMKARRASLAEPAGAI